MFKKKKLVAAQSFGGGKNSRKEKRYSCKVTFVVAVQQSVLNNSVGTSLVKCGQRVKREAGGFLGPVKLPRMGPDGDALHRQSS